MQKSSFLFLLIFCAIALLGAYQASQMGGSLTAFIRFTALVSYLLLCVSLIIGPLVVLRPTDFGQIVEPRRGIGIACFVFGAVHMFLVVAISMNWNLGPLLSSMDPLASVPGTILLLALAVTSSDYAIKVMGPGLWKNVQRLNYLAFIFISVHFIMKANGLSFLSGGSRLNLAEAALLALGLATIGLQIAGFLVRRRKLSEAKEKAAQGAKAQ